MTNFRDALCARGGVLLWATLCLLTAACGAPAAHADARSNVYQVAVAVPDRSEANRAAGFQAAMRVVLVRVTGRLGAASDPEFAPLVAGADRYVQQYRYAIDGRLIVGFDGGAIERWLNRVGAPIWGRTRPLTFVLLTVPSGSSGSIVTSDDHSDLEAAIDAQAALRGIALRWPSAQQLTADGLSYASVIRADPRALLAVAARHGADGLLIGHATGPATDAQAQWLFEYQTETAQASGVVAGVDSAANTYASIYAASGVDVPVELDVHGVRNLADYARTQRLLESMTSVSNVSVLSLQGDTVRLQLAVRGGAAPLARMLALNGDLVPDATPTDGGALSYRLRQ